MWHQLINLWDNLRIRQAAILYAASFAGIPLAIFTSIVFTRFLGPQAYGDFAFLDSLFDFARIIFPLGFFFAGNRALVLNKHPQKAREYYGASLVILFVLFLVMALFMTGYGYFDKNLADKGLRSFFFFLLPFGWIFLLTPYFDHVLHADNRIHELAATRFFPKVVTFAIALLLYFAVQNFDGSRLAVVWAAYLGAFFLVYLMVFLRLRVSFNNLKERIRQINRHHKQYGIHLYIGNLFGMGSVALTGVLISYFAVDNSGVGFFALAVAISRPLSLIPGVIAATWFKDFAGQLYVSFRLFFVTILLSCLAFGALLLLAGPFVRFFYTEDFLPVINLAYIAGAGMFFYGLGIFLNRFLEARGRGIAIRNSFIITGLVLLTCNLLLIPARGPAGAATAMLIASVVYFVAMIVSYRQGVKKQQ